MSWRHVESCLGLLSQCSINAMESNIPLLQEVCLDSVLKVAQHNDHSLCWRCISFFYAVDAIERFPVPTVDSIVIWAGWLSSCFPEDDEYYFHLPPGFRGTVGTLFWTFWLVCSSDTLKCVLCQNLQKHTGLLQDLLLKGNSYTKANVEQVLQDLHRHRCVNQCERRYIKGILQLSTPRKKHLPLTLNV